MDEPTLRRLAADLLDELPDVVTGPADRERVAAAIEAALALPEGQARAALNDTLSEHPSTRAWVRDHAPPDLDRIRAGGCRAIRPT